MQSDQSNELVALRGRVVSIGTERMPIVSGGGTTISGWGRTRIRTDIVERNEFWLRTPDGRDYHFVLGNSLVPDMLLEHPVTVILYRETICAVVNHATQRQVTYHPLRPSGPYRSLGEASLIGCLALLAFGLYLLLFGLAARNGWAILCAVTLLVLTILNVLQQRTLGLKASAYNAAIDRQIAELIALPFQGQVQEGSGNW
jgi:hypothetical protein